MIEALQKQYEESHTVFDELRELEAQSQRGNPDAAKDLDDRLEDLAYETVSNLEEFQTNRDRLHILAGQKSGESEARSISQRQRALLADARRLVASEAGLAEETGVGELEVARRQIQEKIDAAVKEGRVKTPEDALKELGMLVPDEKGAARFVWPEGLFPQRVNEKWQIYRASVVKHMDESDRLKAGVGSQAETKDADAARYLAHNAVSRDVAQILGLDKLDKGWDWEKTRGLLAKMRDESFPNIDTSEEAVTASAVTNGLAIHALATLIKKRGTKHNT
ncbi:MAG TPA: hypothetical protein VFT58_05220 [Nitrososphaera sp.]|nr:hypothetical protein [Nitrososphaera sp.]